MLAWRFASSSWLLHSSSMVMRSSVSIETAMGSILLAEGSEGYWEAPYPWVTQLLTIALHPDRHCGQWFPVFCSLPLWPRGHNCAVLPRCETSSLMPLWCLVSALQVFWSLNQYGRGCRLVACSLTTRRLSVPSSGHNLEATAVWSCQDVGPVATGFSKTLSPDHDLGATEMYVTRVCHCIPKKISSIALWNVAGLKPAQGAWHYTHIACTLWWKLFFLVMLIHLELPIATLEV